MTDHDYATRCISLRIVKEGTSERPWLLDAYDEQNRPSEACLEFATWGEAVAHLSYFVSQGYMGR